MGSMISKLEKQQPEKKSLPMFEKSLECRSALANDHPGVNDYQENLVHGLAEITDFRHKAGRDEDALAGIRRSIEILEGLVATLPDQPRHRAELGHASHVLGYLFDEKRDNELALEALLPAQGGGTGGAPRPRSWTALGSTCRTSSGTWGSNM